MMSRTAFGMLVAALVVAPCPAQLPPRDTDVFYVSSFTGDEIVVYDAAGTYLRSFTAAGLDGPRGIVVMTDGTMCVASQRTDEVFVFDAAEQHIDTFAHAEISGPTGMMLRGQELYVCSFDNDQVVVLDLGGTMLRTFTGGGLDRPNCAALDAAGNIYVSSVGTGGVIKFDTDENFMESFTGGGLSSPMSVARDTADAILVSGGGSNNIVKFDTDGNVLAVISHQDLPTPQGIAFDDRGHFFCSSFSMPQIVEFDENATYVRTITEGGLSVPRSIAFKPVQVVVPESYNAVFGAYQSGTVEDLHESDDAYVVIEQRPAFSVLLPLIRLETLGTAGMDAPASLSVTLEARATSIPALPPQRLSLFNYDSSLWEIIDERLATFTDSVVEIVIETGPGRFIDDGSRQMRMRIGWFDPGNVFSPAWGSGTDRAIWRATP